MTASTDSVRIGVTGHRSYRDPDVVRDCIAAVLDRLWPTDAGVIVVSSLAEGADRLVAGMVLARGGTLHAVLPLDADDYRRDFTTSASRDEFDGLLAAADSVDLVVADPRDTTRERAYEAAGHAMVAASDVVVAVWDGCPGRGRGGTAEIIDHAVLADVPVEVVLVEREAPR